MNEKTDITISDALRGAMQALLRGDYAARDILVAMAEKQMAGRETVSGNEVIKLGDQSGKN